MPEQLADDGQAETRACTDACEGVPQIMKSQTRQIGPFGNQRPRSLAAATAAAPVLLPAMPAGVGARAGAVAVAGAPAGAAGAAAGPPARTAPALPPARAASTIAGISSRRGVKVLRPRSSGPSPRGTPRETDALPQGV